MKSLTRKGSTIMRSKRDFSVKTKECITAKATYNCTFLPAKSFHEVSDVTVLGDRTNKQAVGCMGPKISDVFRNANKKSYTYRPKKVEPVFGEPLNSKSLLEQINNKRKTDNLGLKQIPEEKSPECERSNYSDKENNRIARETIKYNYKDNPQVILLESYPPVQSLNLWYL